MATTSIKLVTLAAVLTFLGDYTITSEYVFSEEKTPAFKDYERFQDIFSLTEANFTEVVLRRPDPWVVIFHDGMLDRGWKSMAVALRGVTWFGMIDINNNKELLKQIEYNPKNDTVARVYKYGTEKTKRKSWKRVDDPYTARATAINSLPDDTLKMDVKELEDFLIDSFMSNPSRFPAVFVTDEKDTSPMMKAVAIRFKKYFHFGKMIQPSMKDLGKLGMQRFYGNNPSLVILTASDQENTASPQFNAIPFDKKSMGELNYPNVLAFLFSVNREFRHLLPGENMSNERHVVEMEDVLKIESMRFDILGLTQPSQSKKVVYEEADELDFEKTVVTNRISDEL